ncbi:MAG: ATP-binding protein [Mogibacterium sp.]|nr:ATP-binding protein [Mogibacterium sp.]
MHLFTFAEINQLFDKFEDAIEVYAQTGGIAQYVMFYLNYDSVHDATADLFFNKDGRLFQEAGNMLMQELRDVTTYVSILRALSAGDKDSGQIAHKADLDPRGIFSYLNRLIDLGCVAEVSNPLSAKKRDRRYRITDALMRFSYTFIEPNASIITALGPDSMPYALG